MSEVEREIETEVRANLPALKENLKEQERLIERGHRSGMDVSELRKRLEDQKKAIAKWEREWAK